MQVRSHGGRCNREVQVGSHGVEVASIQIERDESSQREGGMRADRIEGGREG